MSFRSHFNLEAHTVRSRNSYVVAATYLVAPFYTHGLRRVPTGTSQRLWLGPPAFCRGDVRRLITNDVCLPSHRLPAVCRIVPTRQYVRHTSSTIHPPEILQSNAQTFASVTVCARVTAAYVR